MLAGTFLMAISFAFIVFILIAFTRSIFTSSPTTSYNVIEKIKNVTNAKTTTKEKTETDKEIDVCQYNNSVGVFVEFIERNHSNQEIVGSNKRIKIQHGIKQQIKGNLFGEKNEELFALYIEEGRVKLLPAENMRIECINRFGNVVKMVDKNNGSIDLDDPIIYMLKFLDRKFEISINWEAENRFDDNHTVLVMKKHLFKGCQ